MIKNLRKAMLFCLSMFACGVASADEVVTIDFTQSATVWGIAGGTTAEFKNATNISADGLTWEGITIKTDAGEASQPPFIYTQAKSGSFEGGSVLYGASKNKLTFSAPSGKSIKALKFNTFSSSYVGFTAAAVSAAFPPGETERVAVYGKEPYYVSWVGTDSHSSLEIATSGSFRWNTIEVTLVDGEGGGGSEKLEPITENFDLNVTNNGNGPMKVNNLTATFTINLEEAGYTCGTASQITLDVPGYENPFKGIGTTKNAKSIEISFLIGNGTLPSGEYTLHIPAEFVKYDKSTSVQEHKILSNEYEETWMYAPPVKATTTFDGAAIPASVESASSVEVTTSAAVGKVTVVVNKLTWNDPDPAWGETEGYWGEEGVAMELAEDGWSSNVVKVSDTKWKVNFAQQPTYFEKDAKYNVIVRAWDCGDDVANYWNYERVLNDTIEFVGACENIPEPTRPELNMGDYQIEDDFSEPIHPNKFEGITVSYPNNNAMEALGLDPIDMMWGCPIVLRATEGAIYKVVNGQPDTEHPVQTITTYESLMRLDAFSAFTNVQLEENSEYLVVITKVELADMEADTICWTSISPMQDIVVNIKTKENYVLPLSEMTFEVEVTESAINVTPSNNDTYVFYVVDEDTYESYVEFMGYTHDNFAELGAQYTPGNDLKTGAYTEQFASSIYFYGDGKYYVYLIPAVAEDEYSCVKNGEYKMVEVEIKGGTATSIKNVNAAAQKNVMFNLNGQRVNNAKGIVIINGKKALVK